MCTWRPNFDFPGAACASDPEPRSSSSGRVLLIGWVNVAQLVVARGQDRQHQFALLGALGAGRRRLMALLGMEGLLYGIAATLAALPLSALAERLLRDALPVGSSVSPNPRPAARRRPTTAR